MGRVRLNLDAVSVRAPETTDEWRGYYELRWQILRAPWQQPRGSERDELEDSAVHRLACDARHNILAVGRLHYIDGQSAQIRYMAVAKTHRRRGFGSLVLKALEAAAVSAGRTEIVMHAREVSLPFYRHAGYELVEKSHQLYGEIQHFAMRKRLVT